jgi:hypothetical protein
MPGMQLGVSSDGVNVVLQFMGTLVLDIEGAEAFLATFREQVERAAVYRARIGAAANGGDPLPGGPGCVR